VFVPQALCKMRQVSGGDRIQASTADASRTFKVPVLTAAFDRVSHLVNGRGPVGSLLELYVSRDSSVDPTLIDCRASANVHSTGLYSKNFLGIAGGPGCPAGYVPIGGDEVNVIWTSSHADLIQLTAHVQYINVSLGRSLITGALHAGQSVTIHVRDSAGTLRGTGPGSGDANGMFTSIVRNASGFSVDVNAGDRIGGNWAGHVMFDMPPMPFNVDTSNHRFNGTCMPNVLYRLDLDYGPSSVGRQGRTGRGGETGYVTDDHVMSSETMKLELRVRVGRPRFHKRGHSLM